MSQLHEDGLRLLCEKCSHPVACVEFFEGDPNAHEKSLLIASPTSHPAVVLDGAWVSFHDRASDTFVWRMSGDELERRSRATSKTHLFAHGYDQAPRRHCLKYTELICPNLTCRKRQPTYAR